MKRFSSLDSRLQDIISQEAKVVVKGGQNDKLYSRGDKGDYS